MAIARFPVVVLDCPDPSVMVKFYAALLGWDPQESDGSIRFIRAEYGAQLGFQQVVDFRPPEWPGQDVPQQMHLDVTVDDLDVAESAVLALGATKHDHSRATTSGSFSIPLATRSVCALTEAAKSSPPARAVGCASGSAIGPILRLAPALTSRAQLVVEPTGASS